MNEIGDILQVDGIPYIVTWVDPEWIGSPETPKPEIRIRPARVGADGRVMEPAVPPL